MLEPQILAVAAWVFRNCLAEEEFSSAGEWAYPVVNWQGNCVWFVPSTNPILVSRYKRLIPSLLPECSVGPNRMVNFHSSSYNCRSVSTIVGNLLLVE